MRASFLFNIELINFPNGVSVLILATNTPHKINTPLMQLIFNFVQFYFVLRVFNDQILMESNENIDTELNKVEN